MGRLKVTENFDPVVRELYPRCCLKPALGQSERVPEGDWAACPPKGGTWPEFGTWLDRDLKGPGQGLASNVSMRTLSQSPTVCGPVALWGAPAVLGLWCGWGGTFDAHRVADGLAPVSKHPGEVPMARGFEGRIRTLPPMCEKWLWRIWIWKPCNGFEWGKMNEWMAQKRKNYCNFRNEWNSPKVCLVP